MAGDSHSSRIRSDPERLYTLFAEVVIPTQSNEQPWPLRTFPHKFDNQHVVKMVAQSAVPVTAEHVGSICQGMVTHFSFVLTALDSRWSFGFVRHSPNAPTCLVLVSDLPWHETFYRLLNHISDLTVKREDYLVEDFLGQLYGAKIPQPGFQLVVNYNDGRSAWSCVSSDHTAMPAIPDDRNLTEYFNACDAHTMIQLFTAMLHERRIVIVSRRLNRLSSCVQAANSLIYPMQWQHLFIPVLPVAVADTLNAPMPFLIGVPSSTWDRIRLSELGDVVVYHADQNAFSNPFRDALPADLEAGLKRKLKNPDAQLGDGLAQAFMHVLVVLIGDYRSGFRLSALTGKVEFDKERFLQAQPSALRSFLEGMLQLQIFAEFVENRMKRVNEPILDRFEIEAAILSKSPHKFRYKDWLQQKPASAVRSAYKQVKQTGTMVKDKSRKAYKGIQTKINNVPSPSGPQNAETGINGSTTFAGRKWLGVTGKVGGLSPRRLNGTVGGPPLLQRMHTSPNFTVPVANRQTSQVDEIRQRPSPPRIRPTSPPPAIPIVVNDLICLEDSPQKTVTPSVASIVATGSVVASPGSAGLFRNLADTDFALNSKSAQRGGFEDSFVPHDSLMHSGKTCAASSSGVELAHGFSNFPAMGTGAPSEQHESSTKNVKVSNTSRVNHMLSNNQVESFQRPSFRQSLTETALSSTQLLQGVRDQQTSAPVNLANLIVNERKNFTDSVDGTNGCAEITRHSPSFRYSVSDNALQPGQTVRRAKRFSMDLDSQRTLPVEGHTSVRDLVSSFNELQVIGNENDLPFRTGLPSSSKSSSSGVVPLSGSATTDGGSPLLTNNREAIVGCAIPTPVLPVLQPPPRKADIRRNLLPVQQMQRPVRFLHKTQPAPQRQHPQLLQQPPASPRLQQQKHQLECSAQQPEGSHAASTFSEALKHLQLVEANSSLQSAQSPVSSLTPRNLRSSLSSSQSLTQTRPLINTSSQEFLKLSQKSAEASALQNRAPLRPQRGAHALHLLTDGSSRAASAGSPARFSSSNELNTHHIHDTNWSPSGISSHSGTTTLSTSTPQPVVALTAPALPVNPFLNCIL